jgi:SIR2-like domain
LNIDPLLSLAVSMNAQKGVYALLFGSGVSRSAKILTGWEVVLDLACKLANVSGKKIEEEEVARWYKQNYKKELNYSRLLDELTATQAERQQLLKGYFEPTAEEAEQGIKSPTPAHRPIAELVALGYVRVILTTHFDRLIERAVSDEGIAPTVIASPDAAEGALPFAHSVCSVVKIHGDYLDTRLRNTQEELLSYDDRTNDLLDKVFDEYGLIICGWSGEWDEALGRALERRKSRRFGVYWASLGEPGEQAQKLIDFCQARTIRTNGADTFFPELVLKVKALEDLEVGDPLPPAVAAATVKRYLAEDRFRIRLTDLVGSAVRRTAERLSALKLDLMEDFSGAEFVRRLKVYQTETEVLQHMILPLCQWGNTGHETCAVNIVELAADYSTLGIGMFKEFWNNLRFFPGASFIVCWRTRRCVVRELWHVCGSRESSKVLRPRRGKTSLLDSIPFQSIRRDAGPSPDRIQTFYRLQCLPIEIAETAIWGCKLSSWLYG